MAVINKKVTKSVADLIKIHIDDEKLSQYSSNLNTAIEAVETFSELDTENVPITSQTIGTENIMREDVVIPGLSQSQALNNAHRSKNGYFVVQKVFHE